MKVIAITSPQRSGWKIMAELTREEVSILAREQVRKMENSYEPPPVGTEFDIRPVMERLVELESRERDIETLSSLIAAIGARHIAREAREKNEG